jgi:hypothetical protein
VGLDVGVFVGAGLEVCVGVYMGLGFEVEVGIVVGNDVLVGCELVGCETDNTST